MELRVALAGNPNVGKSTIFNMLTGMHQHVANWPGKTVERKEGICRFDDHVLHIVDLPGIYSLTASSVEELIAREFIVQERPDIVVVIADASGIERNLYLLAQVLELTDRVILALNKMDLAETKGYRIDAHKLQEETGVPTVPMVARRAQGIRELVERIVEVANGDVGVSPKPIRYSGLEGTLNRLEELLGRQAVGGYTPRWLAVKLLEGDAEVERLLKASLNADLWKQVEELLRANERAPMLIADARYAWVRETLAQCMHRPAREAITITDSFDHVLAHPIIGLLIFIIVLACIFWLTFRLSEPLVIALDGIISWAGERLRAMLPFGDFVKGLIIDGALSGFGAVMSLLPVLVVFFILMSVLEDSGYMARVAFVMDGLMHMLKLHGKAALPLILAYGCNVVGVMGSRILESERDRVLVAILNPIIPCSARLSVMAFIVAALFPRHLQVTVMLGLHMINLLMVFVAGILLRLFAIKGEITPLMIELPIYSVPTMRNIILFAWHKVVAFLKRASIIIVSVSIIIWLLSHLPVGAPMHETYLGKLGSLLQPFGKLIGLDWRSCAALVTGFLAKENSLATLSVLYGSPQEGLMESLRKAMTPLQALSFTAFQMLYIPCVATVVAIWLETRSFKLVALAVIYPLVIATIVAGLIYHFGIWLTG
ncbi:MAG: ferrous iron transport protein B [Armatimonadota bacterium]|nr:ferrous iron transport protein B [Armatimonadota bacterium]MDW8025760.1 ferrous iron transport protein B [Armatimonadota bacterium]